MRRRLQRASRRGRLRDICIGHSLRVGLRDSPGVSAAAMSDAAVVTPRRRRKATHTCEECRRRKIRCDRSQPCGHCAKAGVSANCKYSNYLGPAVSRAVGPPQLVFPVDPDIRRPRLTKSGAAGQANAGPILHDAPAPSEDNRRQLAQTTTARPMTAGGTLTDRALGIPRWQLAWNGSRATDTFVEPIGGKTIMVPKEAFRGINGGSATHWGRSHGATSVYQVRDTSIFPPGLY